jgi:isoleucyl-tRNA synthetase
MNQYGPDALRWYMISNTNPWENLKFDTQGIDDVARRFFATLHNTYNFFALYANIDRFDREALPIPLTMRPEIDQWMLSCLHSLTKTVTEAYETYAPTQAARAIQNFVIDDLSNWYVRLNRKRFWKSEHEPDRLAAYQTLYTCLATVAQLAAPIAPFYTEQLYQALHHDVWQKTALSVHLADFPKVDHKATNTALKRKMAQVQKIVSLVHSLRKKHQIKVRQPLATLLLPIADSAAKAQISSLEALIKAEVNVKQITYADDATTVVIKKIKPNFKTLGQRYRAHIKVLTQAIARLGQSDIQHLEQTQHLALTLAPSGAAKPLTGSLPQEQPQVILTLEDVIITSEDIPGWAVANEAETTVALDIKLNDALRQEGIARELVNRLQNLRKEHGLAVQDKIKIALAPGHPFVKEAVQQHKAYICYETQALQLDVVDAIATGALLYLDGYAVHLSIAKHLAA